MWVRRTIRRLSADNISMRFIFCTFNITMLILVESYSAIYLLSKAITLINSYLSCKVIINAVMLSFHMKMCDFYVLYENARFHQNLMKILRSRAVLLKIVHDGSPNINLKTLHFTQKSDLFEHVFLHIFSHRLFSDKIFQILNEYSFFIPKFRVNSSNPKLFNLLAKHDILIKNNDFHNVNNVYNINIKK